MIKSSFQKISVLCCLLVFSLTCYSQKKKVLFIGNSYTTYDGYNIPHKLNRMAKAAGKKVLIRQHTKNGWTLQEHLSTKGAKSKINRRKWDYVVLQEQSWTAIANTEKGMYPAARFLDSLIKSKGGQTVFYLLMPKEYSPNAVFTISGDSTIYYYTVFKDFNQAKDSLQQVHVKIANELGAMVSPVGPAIALALEERTGLDLYRKDRVHHTKAGAYLAACVFYASLFGESPEGNTYRENMEPELVLFFQKIAARIVLEKQHLWNPQIKSR